MSGGPVLIDPDKGNGKTEQATPATRADRLRFTTEIVSDLLKLANKIPYDQRMAMLSGRPTNHTPDVMATLTLLAQGVALLLDEQMVSQGGRRTIQLKKNEGGSRA